VNNPELAEKVLMESLESVQPTIRKLINTEYDKMLNKRDEQRCRVLIPKSRLLFGVCDAWDVLKEGECAVKVTMDGDGQPRALHGMEVLVTRNSCLHPGDLQKFKVAARDELAHLTDCIVFSTRGKRPAADLMSGGDLDGDTCRSTE
jgi:regulator of nonsense transcripts 1